MKMERRKRRWLSDRVRVLRSISFNSPLHLHIHAHTQKERKRKNWDHKNWVEDEIREDKGCGIG